MERDRKPNPRLATEWQVRAMTAADVSAVESILKDSQGSAQWTAGQIQQTLPGDIHIWVAGEAGEVAGMVAARAGTGEAEILNLAVVRGQRGRGLGRCLLEYAM